MSESHWDNITAADRIRAAAHVAGWLGIIALVVGWIFLCTIYYGLAVFTVSVLVSAWLVVWYFLALDLVLHRKQKRKVTS